MRKTNLGLFGVMVCVALICAMATTTMGPTSGAAQKVELKEHWRNHDGHWSYWYPPDNAWYYTDGSHWYYSTGDAWNVYGFDKRFGGEGFERGDYKAPAAGAKIVVPTHRVWPGK